MLKLTPTETTGFATASLGYVAGRGFLGRMALRVTRYLRAVHAERYIQPAERLLDIGCGDGYFLKRSPCVERYGLDKRAGDEVTTTLDFPEGHFDYVTMLAVIEHIPDPTALTREIHRVLKPGGRLVFTTPKRKAEWLIRLYARGVKDEHEAYFDLARVEALARDLFEIEGHHTFLMGLNQVFCLRKRAC